MVPQPPQVHKHNPGAEHVKHLKTLRFNNLARETLDFMYVKFPRKDSWKKFYVIYQYSQLLFFNSVGKSEFKCVYVLYKAFVRRTRVNIGGPWGDEGVAEATRKVDALLISHRYDDESLLLTLPEVYEAPNGVSKDHEFRKDYIEILDEIAKMLNQRVGIPPTVRKVQAGQQLPPSYDIDQTNRNPFGKVLIQVDSIKHFPYHNKVFVRLSFNPFVMQTKNVTDQHLRFKQNFYLPVHNHFNTLKIEIFNSLNDGWLRDHVKDSLIGSYEVRMPDIDKAPFDE